jgi:uncharacterized membrane protein
MTWSVLFRLRRYLRESLWVAPLVGGVVGWTLGIASSDFGTIASLPVRWQYSPSTAESVLASVVAASVGLIGFVVTVSVLIVQMATGTFSARYMRIFYRDWAFKSVLAVLIGTFTLSYTLLRHVEANKVPNLGVTVVGACLGLGIILFVIFLDRAIHRLRPVAVAALVAKAGRRALRQALHSAANPDAVIVPAPYDAPGEPALVVRMVRGGAIQALDVGGLGRWAHANSCLVVLRHPVGDFVSSGAPLIDVYGPALGPDAESRLRSMIALGVERTIEQDPAFAIRIMVDIAIRALSPAVNDPTTAVQVLDHLEDLLRLVGQTDLSEYQERAVADVEVGLVVPIRRWNDYLTLSVTEIREYGARSIQVVRRMRALLESLGGAVLPERRAAVLDELVRLDAVVAATWGEGVDVDLAGMADRQGIGGPYAGPARRE